MAKKTPKSTANKWQSHPNDAIRLAAIRWFACRIEMEAIQVYATDSSLDPEIENILSECITKVHDLVKKRPIDDDGDCPPGYVLCGNECAPRCLFEDRD